MRPSHPQPRFRFAPAVVVLAAACVLMIAHARPARAALQTWTVTGSTAGLTDFGDLRAGSETFLLTLAVDTQTPNLIAGRQGRYAASAQLRLGSIDEVFDVEIGIANSVLVGAALSDLLSISVPAAGAPPTGWSSWQFSISFQDSSDTVFTTGDLPASPLMLDDFDQANASVFLNRADGSGSLSGPLAVTALQIPEPTTAALFGVVSLVLMCRHRCV